MPNKKWILGGAAALAVVVAFIALRSPNTGTNAQGTIGAANRYQSEQVSSADVSLDNPQVAAFIQSDAFRKLASDQAFREAAKSEAFSLVVANENLRTAGAMYNLATVFENANVMSLLQSKEFAKGMMQREIADGLRSANLRELLKDGRLMQLLSSEAVRAVAVKAEFHQLAKDAVRMEARNITALSSLAESYATLRSSAAYKALEGSKIFAGALEYGVMNLFLTAEAAAYSLEALRELARSEHLAEALRVEGFPKVMEGLNAQSYAALVEVSQSAEMLNVLSNAQFREAATQRELSVVAEAGFEAALSRVE